MRITRRTLTLLLCAGVILFFAVQMAVLFRLQADSGANFAPYSTYRADPLGTMALYEAAATLPDVHVERYIEPFEDMPGGQNTTFLIPGASLGPDPIPILESIEGFAAQGGRVVITFRPINEAYELENFREMLRERDRQQDLEEGPEGSEPDEDGTPAQDGDSPEPDAPPTDEVAGDTAPQEEETSPVETETPLPDDTGAPADDKAEDDAEEEIGQRGRESKLVDISERWEFDYGFQDPGSGYFVTSAVENPDLDQEVAWRTGLYFRDTSEDWKPVYLRPGGDDETPWLVAMEKHVGAGSIVLCSDTYFLSNEALRKHRAIRFIHWIAGPNQKLLFSEVHLGTERQERVMTLVRRYRLHGVLFAFVLLGILFVWKNMSTLLPRRALGSTVEATPKTDTERSHQDGLDNLLARFLPPDQVIDTCVREWLQPFQNNPKAATLKIVHEQIQRETGRNPGTAYWISAYNRLARELHKR